MKKIKKIGYSIQNEAWHYEKLKTVLNDRHVYEIVVMINPGLLEGESGGIDAEFMIRWYSLRGKATPQIQPWADSWRFLPQLTDLFAELAQLDIHATPADVIAVLDRIGAVDITQRTSPEP